MTPHDLIVLAADAQQQFNDTIAGIGDGDVRRPTLCPGWTVGHLLTHVARNADSHVRRTEAAVRGELVDQYAGGYEGRTAEIEAAAERSAAELVTDVYGSGLAVEHAWSSVPPSAWDNPTRDVGGRERPLHRLVARRWQELEVHRIDLDLGPTYRDWPDVFVAEWLPRLRSHAGDVAHAGSDLDDREELAWLYGRLAPPGLPRPRPWG